MEKTKEELLRKFNELYGRDSTVFIPQNKREFKVIIENLEYSRKQLLDFKKDIKIINAKIQFYEEVIKEKEQEEDKHREALTG